jgi:hypothetical protein
MTTCAVLPLADLDEPSRRVIRDSLTKHDSDFQKKLFAEQLDGSIALVSRDSEIIGWARSEQWQGHQTLEAFVEPATRNAGVAAFAAAGLVAAAAVPQEVAVFHPHMLAVARRAGLLATLFSRERDQWVIA